MAQLTIRPLRVGSLTRDKSTFTYLRNAGTMIEFPIIIWYIEGADATILVDVAAPPPDRCPPSQQPYVQPPGQSVPEALARVGLRPEEVEIVILTHLHWDHAMNAALFPRANFYVQRSELQYAVAPLPVHYRPYGGPPPGAGGFLPPESKIRLLNGDRAITRGVSVHHLPGHTPGFQAVRVETDAGVHLIAGDNVPFYENWKGEPPHLPHIPSSLHVDLEDYFESFERIERLGDVILPGHDALVLERDTYPA